MKRTPLATILIYATVLFTTLFLFLIMIGLDVNAFFGLVLSIAAGVILLLGVNKHSSGTARLKGQTKQRLPKLTPKKDAFYQSKGLSKEDIHYFRETMQKAKEQIITIETNMKQSGKLRAIEHRNNTVTLSKSLFKEITNEPQRLHEVDKFLYVHLSSLADLVVKYREIENHKAKSKATYDILEKSARTIDRMCGQIAEDYVNFKQDDIEDMDIEVELAKRSIHNAKANDDSFNEAL
ncbi:5-bromo-4-chloroindolyl phosphate hydrolysis family protein [Alkalibacterium sp. MB6]|uniref:5-bromo-4-chloroindolyl phosphate hydrolysis family protein n=1 Tax=Alkalibacterium sp. MB6 TaxID=2081965 RepID=UPI00137B2E90|nr:5-bromo-4-chloroindolyl phosphate hydrolysis family protein [Alkalibacterium sp. MB6]